MWEEDQIGLLDPLFLAFLVQAKRRKGKERKKEEGRRKIKKTRFGSLKTSRLGKHPNSPIIYVFFFFGLCWV